MSSSQKVPHVPDEKLFTINLFSAFVNNNYIKTDRDDWYYLWKIGIVEGEAIGLHSSAISPIMMMSMIQGLKFDFSNWFEGLMISRFFLPFRNSWNTFSPTITWSSGRIKFSKFFKEIELNEIEKKIFNKFIIIKEVDNTIIFLLNYELLKNEGMIKCFIEMFITITTFSNSKSFIIYFCEKFWKFKKIKKIIYDLLTKKFDILKVIGLLDDDNYLKGFMIDLNKFSLNNDRLILILKIWKELNNNNQDVVTKCKL